MINMDLNDHEQSVTLVIPTIAERVDLFSRTLRYLQQAGVKAPILVSDHSPPECREVIEKALDSNAHDLPITLVHHDPSLHFLERLADCAERSGTPYFQLHADDDFICRNGLLEAVAFMERNPGHAACMGDNVRILRNADGYWMARDWKYQNTNADVFTRVFTQLGCYSSALYALRRSDEIAATFRETVAHCPDVLFWQYLETILCSLTGPIEVLNIPYYFRERHCHSWSAEIYDAPFAESETLPWAIFHAGFPQKLGAFVQHISNRLDIPALLERPQSSLSQDERKMVVYLSSALIEFISSRASSNQTGKRFMEIFDYKPNLLDFEHNLRHIADYKVTLKTIIDAWSGKPSKGVAVHLFEDKDKKKSLRVQPIYS